MRTKTSAQTRIVLGKTHPDTDAIQWVTKAVSKDEDRFALMNILIEDNKCIATDGSRLHTAKINGVYANGQYKIIKNTKAQFYAQQIANPEKQYPNYRQVVPKWDKEKAIEIELTSTEDITESATRKMIVGINMFKITVAFYNINQEIYNMNLLIDAVPPNQNWWICQNEKLGPVRIQNSIEPEKWTRMAVVMPVVNKG